MFKITVIIPTYNRPSELNNCIQSILDQTVKPDELIIVDDGKLSELPFEEECRNFGIHYIYYKKDIPGLTASRNKGIELASGDIIFFFDDDVVLFPDYIEEILKVYNKDSEYIIGGVGGLTANNKPLRLKTVFKKIIEILFLISGFKEGKVLPSGFCVNLGEGLFPIKKIRTVDFLSGGISSFRKTVFQEFSFDTKNYPDYGFGEDKDFSFRVSKKYKLLINPRAKVLHRYSQIMRPDLRVKSRMYIIRIYRFFKIYVKKSWWSWLFFYYAIFGYLLIRFFALLLSPDKKRVDELKGTFSGLKDVLIGIH